MKYLVNFFKLSTLSILMSCTTFEYSANDQPKITMKKAKSCTGQVIKDKKSHSFYCGGIEQKRNINLTRIARQKGANKGLCDLSIKEEFTPGDIIKGCCTLGIWTPRTVEIKARKIQ